MVRFSKRGRRRFLEFDEDRCVPKLTDLMGLDEAGFRERFSGTPVLRAKRGGFLRNVAVALGNARNPSAIPVLEKAVRDPDPLIREHVSWALSRLSGGERRTSNVQHPTSN